MNSLRIESEGVAFVHARRARIAAWSVLLGAAALTAAAPVLLVITQWGMVVAVLFLISHPTSAAPTPRRGSARPATVAVEGDEIVVAQAARTTRLQRARLEAGWIDGFAGQHHVVFRGRGGDAAWIRVRGAAEASALLRAAGFAADQHVFSSRLVSVAAERLTRAERFGLICLAVCMGYPTAPIALIALWSGPTALLAAVLAVAVPLLAYPPLRLLGARTALVGTDGVTIKGFFHRRLIPFALVTGASADERGVWLAHPGGARTLLPTMARMSKGSAAAGPAPARLAASTEVLLARVREAMAAQSGQGAAARFAALDRRGRALAEWRSALGALVRRDGGGAGYRDAPLDADDLASVVEDGAAPVERRIGAAMALSSAPDPGHRRRIRIAAGACADEALRAALERAAEGELAEDEVERALRARAR
ncbi:hypothetical protein [Sorangium sp. So ce176]|uniref:hypothetical protein n=1 Tax=Sorangium sp. So ce176 TaxID=3133286 RepID=UPI003F6251B1